MPRKKERHLSRSVRLRKYESAYKTYVQNQKTKNPKRSPHRRHRKKKEAQPEKPKKKKKSLNDYQKFVKKESKKEKYRNMRGDERFHSIAIEWDLKKKKNKRKAKKR